MIMNEGPDPRSALLLWDALWIRALLKSPTGSDSGVITDRHTVTLRSSRASGAQVSMTFGRTGEVRGRGGAGRGGAKWAGQGEVGLSGGMKNGLILKLVSRVVKGSFRFYCSCNQNEKKWLSTSIISSYTCNSTSCFWKKKKVCYFLIDRLLLTSFLINPVTFWSADLEQ